MIHTSLHLLIEAVYLLCPVVACARTVTLKSAYQRARALRRLRLCVLAGTCGGILLCVGYAYTLHGRLLFTQVLLTGYLATSFLLILQMLDMGLWNFTRWMLRLGDHRGREWWYALRALAGLIFRAAIVFCIGLPYLLATVLTYRPRVAATIDPESAYRWSFTTVNFPATDGTPISGWWIPAGNASQTVLVCPGSNTDKASQLSLVRRLIPAGYNVLVFDFRAHGSSGGQLISFGDLERGDVLGAMRWLRTSHPQACKKVAGLGVSTGGAALLAAAADPSPEGQNIDAIAVYDSYDKLENVVDSISAEFFPTPLSWFVDHLGLPLAGFQVGCNLQAFSPAAEIKSIWPRPVLIIHAIDDEIIPFAEGQSLYDAALEPKTNFWIERCTHAGAIKNDAAARMVRQCFDSAQRVI